MPQTAEAQAFLSRIAQLPSGVASTDTLSRALQPSLDYEAELRKLWATNKTDARLRDPHVGLVDIFDAPDDIRKTHARVVTDETDLSAHYILPLDDNCRRKEGEPAMPSSLDEFNKNWAIFTEGSLSQLTDWNNIVAAGGSVQACLCPVPESAKVSKRAMRKYFHNAAFPTSDVDLFLYGLTPEQAEVKMQAIYEAVCDSVPWDVTCVRTKHTMSIHSQYPYRSVQIVLRLYSSPAEILAGFDVDAPCCAFDGKRVWASPRAIVAMMRQCNTVDMTRRSPSYEVRLAKYAMRNFEVYMPTLRRDDIDPTIFERSIQRVQGLARLLVLERLIDADTRQRYLVDRRKLRTRPDAQIDYSRRKKKLKGDLKANIDIGGLEMNDYDVQSLHIPYGPGWDARRIDKLVYQTDLGMNSPYNPKNKDRRLHRHPAFFGTLTECLGDCCEFCPEPKDEEEKELQAREDGSYVRGRVQFIQEDPGRQSISGSFNPIDEGEWAQLAYIGITEKLFSAIVAEDSHTVASIISQEGFDINRRDHVGRTPLQVAILSKASSIACDLIEAGARMTSRLVDGRTALHLAAQLDLPVVVRKLLERSAANAEKDKEEKAAKRAEEERKKEDKMDVDDGDSDGDKEGEEDDDEEDDSSEDDWSSEGGEGNEGKTKMDEKEQKPDVGQIPEDEVDVPDVFDVNLSDWDYALTPLQYAVVFGSLGAIDELLIAGADPKLMTMQNRHRANPFHPLTLTALTRDVSVAEEIVKKLVAGGATSSQADVDLFTIFLRIVCVGKPELVDAFLRYDPNAKAVVNTPSMPQRRILTFPIVSAIAKRSYATLAVLLAHGAKLTFTEEDVSRARGLKTGDVWNLAGSKWQSFVDWPVESAVADRNEVVDLLVDLGAEFNVGGRMAYARNNTNTKKSILDSVRESIAALKKDIDAATHTKQESYKDGFVVLAAMSGWKGALGKRMREILEEADVRQAGAMQLPTMSNLNDPTTKKSLHQSLEYYTHVEELLLSHDAKTWKQLHPDDDAGGNQSRHQLFHRSWNNVNKPTLEFFRMSGTWQFEIVSTHLVSLYEELFQACCEGDNAKIESLCLPKDGKSDKQLLQITARYGEEWGVSPLSLALEHRHWTTARLVLAIAVAQYKPIDAKPPKFKVTRVSLEEDDSDEGTDEDDDMEDDEPEEVNFVDIAQRPSAVQTDVNPTRMLALFHRYQDPKTKLQADGSVLLKAVLDDDFEAFVQTVDLYKVLPKPLELPPAALFWILSYDRPTMLDELIRRTGTGIALPEEAPDEEVETAGTTKSKKPAAKTYLGLNVHGRKRKDLVLKADPNAPSTYRTREFPLLWQAAHKGAVECVRYLSSERPLGAYRYYASTHSDERAQYLRRVDDQIGKQLGWNVDALNESVVTATVIGDHVNVLETIVDLQPTQLQGALLARIHYAGFNNILVAANWGCSPEMFDYLLSKGVSPIETDIRGWNVYHLLCVNNTDKHLRLLRHVLKKLPEGVTSRMLLQQSKKALNTPLHIAVKKKSPAAVRLLLRAKAPMYLTRDCSGSTPLHIATRESLVEITRLIGDAGPEENFRNEDGVGNTPLEIAVVNWLQIATGHGFPGTLPQFVTFNDNLYGLRNSVKRMSADDVKLLKDTIDRLLAQGRLRKETKLANGLAGFAEKMELAVNKRAESDDAGKAEVQDDPDAEVRVVQDTNDATKTFDYISGACAAKPGMRLLVHLIDVHRSVQGSLDRSIHKPAHKSNNHGSRTNEDEGLEPEIEEDKQEKRKVDSFISQWHTASHSAFQIFGDDNV